MPHAARPDAVLFDLDGTLVDTAPDMVAILQELQHAEGHQPIDYGIARNYVSHGAAGLIGLAFPGVDDGEHERLRLAFLERYAGAVCVHSVLFPGLDELLDGLDEAGLPWGVVTNKPGRYTEALLRAMGLWNRSSATVSGDTLAERKPHPEPLLLACRRASVAAANTIYVGDAARDIEAGRSAGMRTVAAAYGYIPGDEDPAAWGADAIVGDSHELKQLLLKAVTLTAG